jgi:hypothetical protein
MSLATCHPGCLRSDPRRVILCQCNCAGQRHGERWIEENGIDEIRAYYQKLEARWERWDRNSRARALKIRALQGGLRKRRA